MTFPNQQPDLDLNQKQKHAKAKALLITQPVGGKTASIGSGLSTKGHGGNQKGDGLSDLGTGKARTNVVAKIDADSATVTGALSKEQIQKVISAYMGQVEYCYERELQKEPNLRGKILVNFVIGLTGAVTSASVTNSTMGNATGRILYHQCFSPYAVSITRFRNRRSSLSTCI